MNLQDNMLIAVDALPRVSISLRTQTLKLDGVVAVHVCYHFFLRLSKYVDFARVIFPRSISNMYYFSHMEQNETYM